MRRVAALILARPSVAVAVIVSAVFLIGLITVWILGDAIANDFSVYWRTANGQLSEVYSPSFEYPFPYAPTMLLWIAPLKLVPLWPAFVAWFAINIAALRCATRTYLNSGELWLLVCCPPLAYSLLTGQVSVVLATLMLWSFGTKNRLLAGIVLGVVATIKPQLVLFAPLLLLLRFDWRAIAALAATFIFVVVLSIALFGQNLWSEWMDSMDNFRGVLNREAIIKAAMTPVAAAENWGLPPLPFLLVGIVAGGWLVYRCRKAGALETTAAVAAASLLASPYGLIYDLAAVAPFLVWSIFRGGITAAVAISAVAPPLPLLLTCLELVRRVRHSSPAASAEHHRTMLPRAG